MSANFFFQINDQSLHKLEVARIPTEILEGLKKIKGQKVQGEKEFLQLITKTVGAIQDDIKDLILICTRFTEQSKSFLVYIKDLIIPRVITHALLSVFLLSLLYGGNVYFRNHFMNYVGTWKNPIPYPVDFISETKDINIDKSKLKFSPVFDGSDPQVERLQAQLDTARRMGVHHFMIMKDYQVNNCKDIVLFSIASAISAISLLLIARKGWESANEYIITTFLVAASVATFYGATQGIFKVDDVYKENSVLFSNCKKLQDEILTYAATGLPTCKVEPPLCETEATVQQLNKQDVNKDVKLKKGTKPTGQKPEATVKLNDFLLHVNQHLADDKIFIMVDNTQKPTTEAFSKNISIPQK